MLDIFITWARKVVTTPRGSGIEIRMAESNISDNPSARLDIDTPSAVARITCWESGDYHAEVINLETEQTQIEKHGHIHYGYALSEEFAPIFNALDIPAQ